MKRRAFLTESGALIGASLMSGSQALGEIPLREEVGSDERTESSYSGRSGTTPLTLEDIHNRMESICLDHAGNGQVGAFFSVVWLISNLASQLKSAEFYMQRLSYPTPFDQISAGLEIDASTITLAINSGRIELSGFAPAIVYREPAPKTGTYSKTTIQFKPVRLRLNQDPAEPGKLRFYIWTADPKDPYYPKFSTQPGTVNTALLQQNGVSQA